ncbi:alpha-1,4-N-acetylglucosaminyltransferase-like [Rana temporaria]|uniref:alpha-1,4-N-acetylglucosaminyltransferase-like n=1 Tax=Rana temporaria TaxID=8407 RepID=UPI001AAE00E1|nr:alpha-1,4-N-acetylglucosaminyltransferase-like [Rana temporaria]
MSRRINVFSFADCQAYFTTMKKTQKIVIFLLLLLAVGFLYKANFKNTSLYPVSFFSENYIIKTLKSKLVPPQNNYEPAEKDLSPSDVLNGGESIIYLETTDKLPPTSLVLCAIESAAHHYPTRSVVFFMKGLTEINAEEVQKKHLSVFSSLPNVYFFPLQMEVILSDTPLLSWYQKVNPAKEIYWAHVSSDACRLALLWKYGGIYMDTDFISLRPNPHHNFLAAESKQYSSNAVLGFSSQHEFIWKCMEDFVKNYHGEIWGYQGPLLFTRIRNQFCSMASFTGKEDFMCGNITILNPGHFYPIEPGSFKRYYEVWDKEPTFDTCYALHLWNYANRGDHRAMVPGSNTLVEHLYQKNCPLVYAELARNGTSL